MNNTAVIYDRVLCIGERQSNERQMRIEKFLHWCCPEDLFTRRATRNCLVKRQKKSGATKNFQLFLITPPVLVNIRVVQPLLSANLGCARCVCKQAFTHSLARAFAPKKTVTGKCVLSELNAKLA